MLRERCNKPMLIIERQRARLLEIYKCIHKLGPRYLQDMIFFLKNRDYDYRNISIIKLPRYNTITHGRNCLTYDGAKL